MDHFEIFHFIRIYSVTQNDCFRKKFSSFIKQNIENFSCSQFSHEPCYKFDISVIKITQKKNIVLFTNIFEIALQKCGFRIAQNFQTTSIALLCILEFFVTIYASPISF